MQKSKKFIVTILIMIILCIVAVGLIINFNNNDRVLKMYNNLLQSDGFVLSMEEVNSDYKYNMKISQKDNNVYIDMNSESEHTSTLIVNDYAYFIMHNDKQYFVYNSENVDGDIIVSGLKNAVDQEYNSGTEFVYGKEYYYEEYSNITAFLILLDDSEEENVKTRFYFDNSDIAYIKNVIKNNGQIEEEIIKVSLTYDVDNSIFEIPNDYSELEF